MKRRLKKLLKLLGVCVLLVAGLFAVDRMLYRPHMDGIDVSHHNVDHGFTMPEGRKPQFIIAKATEGSVYRDPEFVRFRRMARREGIMFGAYHFLSTETPATMQFENFEQTVGDNIDIIPIIDVESHAGMRSLSVREMRHLVCRWSELCRRRYGKTPIIYCNEWYRIKYFLGFKNHFWISNRVCKPLLPASIHQYDHNDNTLDYNHLMVPLHDLLL